MKRPRGGINKTERINMCITTADRDALEVIAEREDRDLGYVAGFFLRWGIEQYVTQQTNLVELRQKRIKHDKIIEKLSQQRLKLREEARRQIAEETSGEEGKKRAS